jgi:hypothetical protein
LISESKVVSLKLESSEAVCSVSEVPVQPIARTGSRPARNVVVDYGTKETM